MSNFLGSVHPPQKARSDDEEDDWIRKPGMSGFVKL
jgi:hypothetical protein